MTYQEALEKSFQVKWEIGTCSQGEKCWCRTIKPIEPILYEDGGDSEYYVVGMGELRKETAEYFVKLHNEKFGGNKVKFYKNKFTNAMMSENDYKYLSDSKKSQMILIQEGNK